MLKAVNLNLSKPISSSHKNNKQLKLNWQIKGKSESHELIDSSHIQLN